MSRVCRHAQMSAAQLLRPSFIVFRKSTFPGKVGVFSADNRSNSINGKKVKNEMF